MYISRKFGRTVFNHVISDLDGFINIQRSLALDELHMYGSSRLGIHKPRRLVSSKNGELAEIGSDGKRSGIGSAQNISI